MDSRGRQRGASGRAELPLRYRMAGVARRTLRGRGTRIVYGSPLAAPIRRMLTSGAPAGLQTVTVCGGTLAGVRMNVDLASEKYYWLGTHEERAQAFVSSVVRRRDVVYDIGAHAGFFTLLFARLVEADGLVYAFEPEVANVARLRENVAVNGLRNVDVQPFAVGDVEGEAPFVAGSTSLQGRLVTESAEATHRVRTTTVDAFVRAGGAPPRFMKIDVEGAEGAVLRGAASTIRAHRPRMLIEVHSLEAGEEVNDALAGTYAFFDLASGEARAAPVRPGHYDARPDGRPGGG